MTTGKIILDAKDIIMGRLASFSAKNALLGKEIDVVNIEQAIITGNKTRIFTDYKQTAERGEPTHGPFIHKSAREIFKRTVKGMLPMGPRGKEALTRVKAYKGIPASLKDAKMESLAKANVSKVPNTKYVRVQDVTKYLGGK